MTTRRELLALASTLCTEPEVLNLLHLVTADVTYTKITVTDKWGVLSPNQIGKGEVVTVVKKSGEQKQEKVGSKMEERTFRGKKYYVYEIVPSSSRTAPSGSNSGPRSGSYRPPSSRRYGGNNGRPRCPHCGSNDVQVDSRGRPYFCDECDTL